MVFNLISYNQKCNRIEKLQIAMINQQEGYFQQPKLTLLQKQIQSQFDINNSMNEEDKKKFIDNLQKNIARRCQSQCKSSKNQDCFERCFEKYIRTIESVNESIKQESYKRHSMVGYKGYPQPQIEMLHFYNPDIFVTWDNYGFARKWDASV